MTFDLVPASGATSRPARRPADWFVPLWITLAALRNGMRWCAGPGTGKTWGIALTTVWPHLWNALPAIVIDPTGALCSYVINKIMYYNKEIQQKLWNRIRYIDLAATDYIAPLPLYQRRGEETLFAVANRFPAVLKRQDPNLASAPILGWNSLWECAIYAGQIATALGRQLDFVADLIAQPRQYKEELRLALARAPELARAVGYFRELMDPNNTGLRERRTGSLSAKLLPFLADPVLLATFAAHRPGIDWAAEMAQGRTVLLDFSGETDRERRQFKLIWCFLEIVEFLKSRGIAGRQQPVLLVIDEVSSLLNEQSRDGSILGQDLHELITVWARNVGIKLCLAHQYPSQLEPAVNHALLQLGTQVVGNVQNPDDALYLARQFHYFDPYLVKKREPVWMNVQESVGQSTYSVPQVIDYRTTEVTADEQLLIAADAIRHLPKFHFWVRPATGEGNLTGQLRHVRLDRLDAGLYPDEALVAEVRRRLRKRDGMALATLLEGMAPCPSLTSTHLTNPSGPEQSTSTPPPSRVGSPKPARRRRKGKQQHDILETGETHDPAPLHPLPEQEGDAEADNDAWKNDFWQ